MMVQKSDVTAKYFAPSNLGTTIFSLTSLYNCGILCSMKNFLRAANILDLI